MYDLAMVFIYTNILLVINNGFLDFSSKQRRATVAPHRET
jgi:hypothetical protein